jgi:type VI secretion system secreted protein VgrG
LLHQALSQMQSLADTAHSAQAIAADYAKQKLLLDNTLKNLSQAGLLISAPAGVGVVSGGHLQLSATDHLIATAGGNADIGVWKNFTVAAGQAISLFASTLGIKLFAGKGKVQIQAQSDALEISALKDISITSSEGKVTIRADKEIWIGAGGSYVKLTATGIENGTPGDIVEKCAIWDKQAAASMTHPVPPFTSKACQTSQRGARLQGNSLTRLRP